MRWGGDPPIATFRKMIGKSCLNTHFFSCRNDCVWYYSLPSFFTLTRCFFCLCYLLKREPRENVLGVFEILLHLSSHVEYGAIGVRTENFLVERALASLALDPQLVESFGSFF